MRGTLLAVITAAGIGLAGTAGVSAAPFGGSAIGNAANETSTVEHVQQPVVEVLGLLVHHVIVVRVALHGRRLALHVHETDGALGFAHGSERPGRLQRLHIVDHGGAGVERRLHHRGPARIHR